MIAEFILCTIKLICLSAVLFYLMFHLLFDAMADFAYYYYKRDMEYVGKQIAIIDSYKVAGFFSPIMKNIIIIPYSKKGLMIRACVPGITAKQMRLP